MTHTEALQPRRRSARTKIRADLREGESGHLNRHWRTVFLDKLADTSNVSAAAQAAGVTTARAYKTRRSEIAFARQWHKALMEGYEHLEMETLYRLRMGAPADGPKFDIGSALRLLALHQETAQRERARHEDFDEAALLASINARIAKMREREKAARKLLPPGSATATQPDGTGDEKPAHG
ncbi:hypothetical protein [Altericroceibacterium spongiae]|uniref:hypothetical protein n=1 Tax=Altericroceibacterium spongiae TaxID=2320269 RepID=UPI0016002325|nr:hypothetical protein [Altericroceibacterium spongiae]